MKHYAEIDKDKIVKRVIIADKGSEEATIQWLKERVGGDWLATDPDAFGGFDSEAKKAFRKNAAAPGFSYDENLDAFIPPKEFQSWILNEETYLWEPPKPKPDDGLT